MLLLNCGLLNWLVIISVEIISDNFDSVCLQVGFQMCEAYSHICFFNPVVVTWVLQPVLEKNGTVLCFFKPSVPFPVAGLLLSVL